MSSDTYIGTCVYIKYLHNVTNILIPMTSALLDDLVAYMLAIKIEFTLDFKTSQDQVLICIKVNVSIATQQHQGIQNTWMKSMLLLEAGFKNLILK